ncbi:PDR/VanB family oxidoreductase [Streptomyces sp. NRRL S-87]|uniref:PDR/VanB family oxidoreductase n=1 Tax=Streptomyces sp. NRRL S-87 TaxID=1463920 RepID=UPI0004C29B25|nr:PDR/VanB family oxidoreductase [Streptomyces sp. NRRL S-87]
MPRLATVAVVAAAGLVARRAVRSRIKASPLWPLPALAEPVSGRSPRRPLYARITGREEVAEGVVRIRVESDDLPAWEPGAHVDVHLPSGLVRQYSLCGDPAERGAYVFATRLVPDGRGGSREVHEQLAVGAELELRTPRNRFPLVPAPRYVFVAGGIGLTPILPMLRAATAAGADWHLHYGGRSRASMPFLPELAAYGDRVTVVPEDEAGPLDLSRLAELPTATAVYCCGPEPLMDAVSAALAPGVPLHLERFAPASRPAPESPFTLELARSGRTVEVSADTTALAAVRTALPDTPYSCEQGFCGTCRHRVLAGEVDHRDDLLTDEERTDSMLLCVSRAEPGSHLVLDA